MVNDSAQADSRRQALMNAAIKLFAQNGFDGVSVREIADEAKVNVSLVNYYFSGKEGLYKACLQEFGQSNVDAARRVLKPAKACEEFKLRLAMFCEEFIEFHYQNFDLVKMVQGEFDCGAVRMGDIFKNTFFVLFETLADYFKHAQKNKIVRDDLDVTLATRIFFAALVHNLKMDTHAEKLGLKSMRKTPKVREQFIQHLMQITCYGLVNSELKDTSI